MSDLTEDDLRRRREAAQRVPRESGDAFLRDELSRLRHEVEEFRSFRQQIHGTGGLTVNFPHIGVEEQRKRGGVVQTELVHFNKAGTFVARRMLVAGPATTNFL